MRSFIIIILVFVLAYSCMNDDKPQVVQKPTEYPVIQTLDINQGGRIIRLYVIDSCEYIGSVNWQSNDILAHKGNCKYCKQRLIK